MSISDNQIKIGFSLFSSVIIFLVVLGLVIKESLQMITVINFVLSVSILLYWLVKEFQRTVHYFGTREMVALFFELLALLSTIYFMYTNYGDQWMFIVQCVIFGVHAIALVILQIFMWTFKMKRLF